MHEPFIFIYIFYFSKSLSTMCTSLLDLHVSDLQLCPDFKFMDTQRVEMDFLWGL